MPREILVVDDDRVLADAVADTLRGIGLTARTAYTCQEARDRVACAAPGLLVLDISLPDGNGLSLLEELRGHALAEETPVILVSSHSVTRSELRRRKVNEFMPKPFDMRKLTSKIETMARN